MTTVVAAKKNGFAAIGADSLTTYGGTKESAEFVVNNSKIIKVKENYFAPTGHASCDLIFQDYFQKKKTTLKLSSPNEIFRFSLKFHAALKKDYFLHPDEDDEDEFESIQMRCLIANPYGIFGLYQMRSVQEYSKFYAMGSGYPFALGAMHAIYDKADTAEEIVRAGLEAAAIFDDRTASPFEICSVKLRRSASSPPSGKM